MKITFNPNLLSLSSLLLAATLLLGSCKKNNNYPVPVNTPQLQINSFAPDSGAMGATVVIHGSGFGNSISGIKVMFNGLPATVSAVSDNSLTVVVPIHAGSGKINVQLNPTHQAASITDFKYLYTVTTLAGSTGGYHEGTGSAALFNHPYGVAVDAKGTIYVADGYNNCIRKITTTAGQANVTTFAGNGYLWSGYVNAKGNLAKFDFPYAVAVDATGNIYVVDLGNQCIRKVDPTGVVTTLAGDGTRTPGFNNGSSGTALFQYPGGVTTDASGNVYVGDSANERIRKIAAGQVSTLAGSINGFHDGTGGAALFSSPSGVATDVAGNVYVADTYNNRIREVSPVGVVSTFAGDGTYAFKDGTGTAAEFNSPASVAVDAAGNVYVADQNNNRIRKITPAGLVTTIAGDGKSVFKDGIGNAAEFNYPYGIAVDAAGNIYVADTDNNRIRKLQ